MTAALIIGSTVCDVMIYLDRLPSREGDAHIDHQQWSVGGCAFNILHFLSQPYQFVSPVGSGMYGDFIRRELKQLGISSSFSLEGANGCCYCFVESDGERTFLSDHGVEYSFQAEWLKEIETDRFDYIYLCGLEVEEPTGLALVQSVSQLEGQVIFQRIDWKQFMICIQFSMLMRLKHWLFQGVERSSQPSNTCIRERDNWSLSPWVKKERLPMMATGMRQTVFQLMSSIQ